MLFRNLASLSEIKLYFNQPFLSPIPNSSPFDFCFYLYIPQMILSSGIISFVFIMKSTSIFFFLKLAYSNLSLSLSNALCHICMIMSSFIHQIMATMHHAMPCHAKSAAGNRGVQVLL